MLRPLTLATRNTARSCSRRASRSTSCARTPVRSARNGPITGGRSIAALHTKALVVDRRSTFVGSFNLDPRSANINTEVGLLVDSPELAQQVASYLDAGVDADNAYHVTLDARGHTRWSASVDGQVVTYDHEPQTSAWKRFTADVIRILPIDSQL